ncbi:hypothetical protein CLOM_g17542 [Closterium sp. NIES-68]|nr:hypothetical protein CLOM_g17542 [Closterium sp. NIES-68]
MRLVSQSSQSLQHGVRRQLFNDAVASPTHRQPSSCLAALRPLSAGLSPGHHRQQRAIARLVPGAQLAHHVCPAEAATYRARCSTGPVRAAVDACAGALRSWPSLAPCGAADVDGALRAGRGTTAWRGACTRRRLRIRRLHFPPARLQAVAVERRAPGAGTTDSGVHWPLAGGRSSGLGSGAGRRARWDGGASSGRSGKRGERLPFLSPPRDDDARAGDCADLRKQIVQSAPRATVDELASASEMARLSALVYHRDPAPHVSALGLTLRACQQTPFTAYMVVDSPPCPRDGGRTRYVIARGVAVDRREVHVGRLWRQLLQVVVHGGVLGIAEDVYRALLPLLAADLGQQGITRLRFGGHSLGGSLALLLMLMFHLRAPNKRAHASALHLSAHTFGSFPVLASLSSSSPPSTPHSLSHHFAHSSGDLSDLFTPAHAHASSPLLNPAACRLPAAHSFAPHLHAPPPGRLHFPHAPRHLPLSPPSSPFSSIRKAERCSVLASVGLPCDAARAFVLDRDIIPRAFHLAHPLCSALARTPLLRALLGLHPSPCAPPLSPHATHAPWGPLTFQPVGLVHYMQAMESESLVASLPPALAEKALAMGVGELVRDPLMLARSIRDHCFHHYVHFLDAALHAARHDTQE